MPAVSIFNDMKKLKIVSMGIGILLMLNSCIEKEEIDKTEPEIDLTLSGAFPQNCDTLYFGEAFPFKIRFTDNVELGSFSIDIHHNFDHHSHSTEVTECVLDPIKEPVNPFTMIEDYAIPEGAKLYEPELPIVVPSGNGSGLYDEGDYHLFISLTDKEGWSAQMGLSIKMLHRR